MAEIPPPNRPQTFAEMNQFLDIVESLPKVNAKDFVWSENAVSAMLKILCDELLIKPKGEITEFNLMVARDLISKDLEVYLPLECVRKFCQEREYKLINGEGLLSRDGPSDNGENNSPSSMLPNIWEVIMMMNSSTLVDSDSDSDTSEEITLEEFKQKKQELQNLCKAMDANERAVREQIRNGGTTSHKPQEKK